VLLVTIASSEVLASAITTGTVRRGVNECSPAAVRVRAGTVGSCGSRGGQRVQLQR
jgi:hypothetical protein